MLAILAAFCVGALSVYRSISRERGKYKIDGVLRRCIYNSGQFSRDIFTNRKRPWLWSFGFQFSVWFREGLVSCPAPSH
ncbi:hypothetical protein RJT34_12067 [Clitoria ternatea]|uniref:Uncharacterized protein n=1 Tax=Clitoria ternatea TaxID=43366 RepID=A0AAN9PK49_CLITE